MQYIIRIKKLTMLLQSKKMSPFKLNWRHIKSNQTTHILSGCYVHRPSCQYATFVLVGGITSSSAVAERPRDVSCHWIFRKRLCIFRPKGTIQIRYYGRPLSVSWRPCYVLLMFLFFYFFYGRLILRPWLTEVRESFTRGGPWVALEKLLLGFFPGHP